MKNQKGFTQHLVSEIIRRRRIFAKRSELSAGFTVIEALLILVIVGIIGGVGWYVWDAKKESDKSLDSASQQDIKAAGKKTETQQQEQSIKIPEGFVEYTNEKLGFAFAYPSKRGTVKEDSTYGTENKEALLYTFAFSNLCDTCGANDKNTSVPMSSPGLIEMGATVAKYGGIGSSRPYADSAGFKKNSDGSITFLRAKDFFNVPRDKMSDFKGKNTTGLIIRFTDDFHNLDQTSVVFNLNGSEATGFEFMTHDKIGETKNHDLLKSIASTFRLL